MSTSPSDSPADAPSDSLRIDTDVVQWSVPVGERAGRPWLVMLHGYGADENDLFGLVPALPDDFVVASVRAPLQPPFPAPGYSWYPIEDVTAADMAGRGTPSADRVTAAASAVLAWLNAAAGEASSVGLLGFSQGASVSLQALRLAPTRLAFVLNLSGYAVPVALPSDEELAAHKPPVFWGRGAQDAVIPPALVEHTTQWLPAHSDLSGRVYPDLGHAVSEQELADIRVFLGKQLAALAGEG